MKPVKYFVKAVAINRLGRVLKRHVLTPAMATEDQAFDYINWLNSTTAGAHVCHVIADDLEGEVGDGNGFSSVQFIKFESALY